MSERVVHHGDGLAWLRDTPLGPRHALITSLPDVSELTELNLQQWQHWFVETASLVCRSAHPQAVAIFYQTDIKHDGRWVDKAHLVQRGADAAGVHCLWHKIVCRTTPGLTTFGRPAYGHWLAFSAERQLSPGDATADVIPSLGEMTWSKAMPMNAAVGSCEFLRDHTECDTVVDPFCGRGTILAVANTFGLHAIGVERSKKRVKKARALVVG